MKQLRLSIVRNESEKIYKKYLQEKMKKGIDKHNNLMYNNICVVNDVQ